MTPPFHGKTITEGEEIEKRFRLKLAMPEAVDGYQMIPETKGGKILDVDLARWLFPEYEEGDNKERTKSTVVTHQAASEFIQMLYAKKLKQTPTGGAVIFLAGGAGSGQKQHREWASQGSH